jgi:Mn-dependent DtxR family transcriptional regulator
LPQKHFKKVHPSTLCNKSDITPSSVTKVLKKLQSRSYRDAELKIPPHKGDETPKSFLRGCRVLL